MTDLTDFLRERLAEDQAAAEATLIDVTGSGDWRADEHPVALTVDLYRVRDVNARPVVEGVKSLYDDEGPAEPLYVDGEAVAAHIARHDPARVLREVAAKRAIMERHCPSQAGGCAGCGVYLGRDDQWHPNVQFEDCEELLGLAAIYADHSEYDPQWGVA